MGWAVDDHMRTSWSVRALPMACWRRKSTPGLLHHSEWGSQYAGHQHRQQRYYVNGTGHELKVFCWGNAPTEHFFRSLKHEALNDEHFRNKEAAINGIIDVLFFITANGLTQNQEFNDPYNLSENFIRKRLKKVFGFCWPLHHPGGWCNGQDNEVFASMSANLRLKDNIDIGRGDMIVGLEKPPHTTQDITPQLSWLSANPLQLNGK